MAQRVIAWDDTKKRHVRTTVDPAAIPQSHGDIVFTVTGEGVTEISVSGYFDITPTCKLDVFRNGQLLLEGEGLDYQRDSVNDKVVFSYVLPITSKIQIRVYPG